MMSTASDFFSLNPPLANRLRVGIHPLWLPQCLKGLGFRPHSLGASVAEEFHHLAESFLRVPGRFSGGSGQICPKVIPRRARQQNLLTRLNDFWENLWVAVAGF